MKVSELRVGAVEYFVGRDGVAAVWTDRAGATGHAALGATTRFLSRVENLRDELRDTMALARGRVPRLREFSEDWGRELLPEKLLADELDVLVIVPHALLHDVPLHLVRTGAGGEPLGAVVGITYASSRSLFVRCAGRNPARARDPADWVLDAAPVGSDGPGSLIGGGADVLTGDHEPFRSLAESLSGLFEPDRVSVFEAGWPYSRSAVKAAFRREPFDAVCVVAHGYTDPDNHRMSGLLVELDTVGISSRAIPLHGGRYFDFRDLPLRRLPPGLRLASPTEILTTAELEVDGHVETQLVVLLACSAGWGRVVQGDEPASLAESFLHIGAPSVLAPMWDSDREPTSEWAHQFFEAWVDRGYPKALAARHAMTHMQTGRYADHPERLGALALKGDWL